MMPACSQLMVASTIFHYRLRLHEFLLSVPNKQWLYFFFLYSSVNKNHFFIYRLNQHDKNKWVLFTWWLYCLLIEFHGIFNNNCWSSIRYFQTVGCCRASLIFSLRMSQPMLPSCLHTVVLVVFLL